MGLAFRRFALLLTWLSAASGAAQQAPDGSALFATLCARCHGLLGDGQGAEVLDRPARSFRDGGFSFGNTAEAVERTITHGIPGTPMPAFGETLEPAAVAALARHVLALAPAMPEPEEAETILRVGEHAVIARGPLPPIDDDGEGHPRGLLVGLPSGLSFEYRCDDLRLLAVRAGDFVRRDDWTGRGGQTLTPLGQLIWRATDAPLLHDATTGEPLRLRLRETSTSGDARIAWDAVDADGHLLARGHETPRAVHIAGAAGFLRVLVLDVLGPAPLRIRWTLPSAERIEAPGLPAGTCALRHKDRTELALLAALSTDTSAAVPATELADVPSAASLTLTATPGRLRVVLLTLPAVDLAAPGLADQIAATLGELRREP